MEYVLSDLNSAGMNAYWFARDIPTLDLAKQMATQYPDAKYILEYKSDYQSKGLLPTGRSWKI